MYAVFLCAIIASLCAALLYVFASSKLYTNRLLIKNTSIQDSRSCFNQFFFKNNEASFGKKIIQNGESNICEIEKSKWGLLYLIRQKVFFKKDTLSKNIFAGVKLKDSTALYVTDLEKRIKISGTTKIIGQVYAPGGRVENVSILGNQAINNSKIIGTVFPLVCFYLTVMQAVISTVMVLTVWNLIMN